MFGIRTLGAGYFGGRSSHNRRGALMVLAAVFMVIMAGFIALAVDVGYMMSVNSEMKRATDAAALAGAGCLIDGADDAKVQAFKFLARNSIGGETLADDENWELICQNVMSEKLQNKELDIEFGTWDPEARVFTPGTDLPSTVRVATTYQVPTFFARAFSLVGYLRDNQYYYYYYDPEQEDSDGYDYFKSVSLRVESIARYQPRDIALVLDFSGSMNDDSELKRIDWSGNNRETVEASLANIYGDLGSPNYGQLHLEPEFVTIVGAPPALPNMPQITVQFRSNDVFVTSTKDISNVVMQFSDGSYEKIELESGTTGAFRGTGYNYYKRIVRVWVKSGINESGDGSGYGEKFEDDYNTIREYFGLNSVAYPYASGSWDSYIYYVKTNSNVHEAGYRRKYGFLTLINYWLESKPKHSQTCDLWKVRAEPVDTVKRGVDVFMDYIQEVDAQDRVGLVVYNSPSQEALVEHQLSGDFDSVINTIKERQAGHYDVYTNIGAGIQSAIAELDSNARVGAFKMIVLMTDGQANRPSYMGSEFALQQANIAAESHYPIVTISLGSGADTELMEEIAARTGGLHFNVPGDSTITNYRDALLGIFRTIADHRPLSLVK